MGDSILKSIDEASSFFSIFQQNRQEIINIASTRVLDLGPK